MAGDRKTIGWGRDNAGRDVRIDWETNTDRPNRGYICHQATAWHDDEFQGFLRVAYVDREEYDRHNPTVWDHFRNFSGMCLPFRGEDPRALRGEKAAEFYRSTLHYLGLRNAAAPPTYEEFEAQARATRRYQDLMRQREEFFEFHLGKPYVDYADVSGRNLRHFTEGAPDRRGEGVGKLLYFGTAHALADTGLPFHSSGIQSDDARGIWARFGEMGLISEVPIVKDRRRLRLNADRIPESLFSREGPIVDGPSL